MTTENKREYQVGHGRPPVDYQFKKGQSGNPKGRPRGSKNLMTLLHRELEQAVVVQENGRRRKITKREAMITQVVNKAALSGNIKAFLSLLPHIQQADAEAEAQRERTEYTPERLSTLAEAVQILADMGMELPVPKTKVGPKPSGQ